MDVIIDIIKNIEVNTTILLTIVFKEKYNISIGKDDEAITIFLFEIGNEEIIKFHGSEDNNLFPFIIEYLQKTVENVSMDHIKGISSIENKKYLTKYFLIKEDIQLQDSFIHIEKYFI